MTAASLAAILAVVAGILALRRAWADAGRSRLWVLAGWALLAMATAGWAWARSLDKAVALALLTPSPAAYLVVAAGARLKRGRTGRVRDSVDLRPGGAGVWRGLARCLLAGPASAIAAVAIGTIVSLDAPWDEPDRIIAAGLLTPALWASCMCWSLSDGRLGRVAIGLAMMIAAASATAL